MGEYMKIYPKIKRVLDFILSLIALIVLLPVFIIISIVIKIDSKGPVLFKQTRIGEHKKEFKILKFRTMRTDTPDLPTHLLNNPEVFITKVGRFLRKTSLDELPQLINIVKGEMSVVGPRPALWTQEDLISERDKYGANDIKPGLTGWAQVNGRDELPIAVKAQLDGEYIKRKSLMFDMKIIFKTVISVTKSEGIVEGNQEVRR